MKNPKTGLYECSKYYSSTGATVTGTGETQEAAKADFKTKLAAYRKQPLVPTGEEYASPGNASMLDKDGVRVSLSFNPDRKGRILARPELAEWISKGRPEKS